ncbi:MAG TPA: addiction module toxin, HicA family [Planctomycetales bacterium]|jgi:predicted RNA binding protein YcfA (HicA-like mRNA interferase family)|nr:addiction module toxin, HicA family [Planctomycetales bacterium]
MKRVDLIHAIEGLGCEFVRHGGKHDWYRNPTTGVSQPVPRHREIKDVLARHIIKLLNNPPTPPAVRQKSDGPA